MLAWETRALHSTFADIDLAGRDVVRAVTVLPLDHSESEVAFLAAVVCAVTVRLEVPCVLTGLAGAGIDDLASLTNVVRPGLHVRAVCFLEPILSRRAEHKAGEHSEQGQEQWAECARHDYGGRS